MEYLGPIILINATKKGEIFFNYEENRGFQEDTPDFFRVHQQTYDCYHPRGRATAVCLFQWDATGIGHEKMTIFMGKMSFQTVSNAGYSIFRQTLKLSL